MRRQIANSLLLFVIILLVSTPAIQTVAQDKDSAAAKEKEVTILVDHYRAPCVDGFRFQCCYLVATADKPNEFPYFYGEIEGFKFQWGHQYRLLAVRVEAPQFATSPYNYRLVKILSDKKIRTRQTFHLTLKAPAQPPILNVDESSNMYLFGEVKINTINAKLKARLLRLLQVAGPLDSISGSFRHDQKQENVITLISLLHGKH